MVFCLVNPSGAIASRDDRFVVGEHPKAFKGVASAKANFAIAAFGR